MDEAEFTSLKRCYLDLRLFQRNFSIQRLDAVLVTLVERLAVQVAVSLGNRIGDGIAQRVGLQQAGYRSEEADHHNVEHHLLAQLFGKARRRAAIHAHPGWDAVHAHQVLLDDQRPVFPHLRRKDCVGLVRHHHQHVGTRDIGIKHRSVGQNDLRAASAAAGFRAEALRHGGKAVFVDAACLANDNGRENHALAAKPCDTDFG